MRSSYKQPFFIILLSMIILTCFLCNVAFTAETKYWEQTGFWYENRMAILCALIILLILFYKSVWVSYGKILTLYRGTYFSETKPPLTAPQASYIYSQHGTSSFLACLIQACQSGTLKLQYKKNRTTPWYIALNKTATPNASWDQELLDILFSDDTKINIEGAFSADPNPIIKRTCKKFIKHIRTDTSDLLHYKPTSLPAWVLLVALLSEMPYLNGLGSNDSMFYIFTAPFLVIIIALLIFGLRKLLPLFVPNAMSLTIATMGIAIATAVAILFHRMLVQELAAPYFTLYLYPELVTAIGVLVFTAPVIPKDINLLAQSFGYQACIGQASYPIKEQDLPWTVGLETHLFGDKLEYQENQLPEWLDTDERDIQKMIICLHQEFPSTIKRAIFGQSRKGLRRSRSRSDFSRS